MEITPIDYTSQARTRYTDQFKNNLEFDALVTTFTDLLNLYQNQYLIFKDRILDINYQQGSGLDIIGGIVGQSRLLVDFNQGVHFGFEGAYKSGTFGTNVDPNIGAEWFSSLTPAQGSGRILTDEEYRNVIKARIIFNKTTCNTDDFVEVLNLLTFSDKNSVDWSQHGVIQVNIVDDRKSLSSYFLSLVGKDDNIFPVPLGYRVGQNYNVNFSEPYNIILEYNGNINITWDVDGVVDFYRIYKSTTPIDENNLPTPIITNLRNRYYIDTDVVSDTTYYYRVESVKLDLSKISLEHSISTTGLPLSATVTSTNVTGSTAISANITANVDETLYANMDFTGSNVVGKAEAGSTITIEVIE